MMGQMHHQSPKSMTGQSNRQTLDGRGRCGAISLGILAICLAPLRADDPPKPAAQNPSPMVEHTRTHPRLKEERPPGARHPLKIGTLFVPDVLPPGRTPLFVHFHGGTWLPE